MLGRDNVTEPVEAEAVIWFAVPVKDVTPLLVTAKFDINCHATEDPVPTDVRAYPAPG